MNRVLSVLLLALIFIPGSPAGAAPATPSLSQMTTAAAGQVAQLAELRRSVEALGRELRAAPSFVATPAEDGAVACTEICGRRGASALCIRASAQPDATTTGLIECNDATNRQQRACICAVTGTPGR